MKWEHKRLQYRSGKGAGESHAAQAHYHINISPEEAREMGWNPAGNISHIETDIFLDDSEEISGGIIRFGTESNPTAYGKEVLDQEEAQSLLLKIVERD